jgi:regulator of sirC expression with transglutaminase-like and TPR domain
VISRPISDRFRTQAARLREGSAEADLVGVALLLASELVDDVDEEWVGDELDRLGVVARKALAGCADDDACADALLQVLDNQGFRGNSEKYADPRNSLLHEVLSRRKGIPITLSIVAIAVAERAGFVLHGVSFPAHFLIRTATDPPILLDPFHGARITEAECQRRALAVLGPETPYNPDMLRIATPLEVALRITRNLKHVFTDTGNWLSAIDCCDRILLLAPETASEWRDRGNLWVKLQCTEPAIADFEQFLALVPDAEEAEQLAQQIAHLRAQAPPLH